MPGGGPSLQGDQWAVARHPKHRRRKKPYLTDNIKLGQAFRDHYVGTLRKLLASGKLKLGGSVEFLKDPDQRDAWLDGLEAIHWNVFIQGPPHGKSDPQQVVKYLAGYLTGGPIHDRRLISLSDDEVTFWARPKHNANKTKPRGMNPSRHYRLNARQFMQRWTLHILPKGFTRSRSYGGYHRSKRQSYLSRCRELLHIKQDDVDSPATDTVGDSDAGQPRKCPGCDSLLVHIRSERRPSWSKIFEHEIYRQPIYSPQHHIGLGPSPRSQPP